MSEKDKVKQKIEEKNNWYVASQLEAAKNNVQKRIIEQRINIIMETINNLNITSPVILDAGCGDGVLLQALQQYREASLWGVDYNPLRLERARKIMPRVNLRKASLKSLDFNDEYFDIIVMNQVLEHIKEDEEVLREMYRVLKKEGVFILGVPNEGCLMARLRNNLIQPEIKKTTDHIHFYTVVQLKRVLENNSFEITNIWRQSFFTPYMGLNSILATNSIGFKILEYLGKILPSQCASIYLACRKD